MIRGTSPNLVFEISGKDLNCFKLETIYFTFVQSNRVILEKNKSNGVTVLDENNISVKLTQEETLSFDSFDDVEIQMRAIFGSGDVVATDIVSVDVKRILKEGVISNDETD